MGGVRTPGRVIVVIPFREGGKSRLPERLRREAGLAMLADVLAAAAGNGRVLVVTDDPEGARVAADLGAVLVPDPGTGQGAAVAAALVGATGPCLVVNADLPCATSADLALLVGIACRGAFGLVAAPDGTTNALALPSPAAFAPLYGAGSAARFRAHGTALGLELVEPPLAGLTQDVDTIADLERLPGGVGPRTRALLEAVGA